MRRLKKILISLLIVVVVFGGGFGAYFGSYYRADEIATTAMLSNNSIITECDDNRIIFKPEEVKAGLIFYPGANIEYTAYSPLMQRFAEKGIMCVLIKMPLNHAVFDINAADGIKEEFSYVKSWYIGGHSLGGAMAGNYAAENADEYDGLVLLASFSTADLSNTDLKVASIYGSKDGVLDMEKYRSNHSNLPENTTECIISGGNHAQFGSYGEQRGDNKADITAEEQIEKTAEAVSEFIDG